MFGSAEREKRLANGERLSPCVAPRPLPGTQRVMEVELEVAVHIHDGGSRPAMYDFRIGPSNDLEGAIEVTAALDEDWTEVGGSGLGVRAKSSIADELASAR